MSVLVLAVVAQPICNPSEPSDHVEPLDGGELLDSMKSGGLLDNGGGLELAIGGDCMRVCVCGCDRDRSEWREGLGNSNNDMFLKSGDYVERLFSESILQLIPQYASQRHVVGNIRWEGHLQPTTNLLDSSPLLTALDFLI
ncbi:hypothetical protein FPV67DRAFT_1456143 [Lyophyllum atratum]|nr:hypothetical protein FPV67DRAFT_1456143 [Lyophyllum atratum]